MLHDRALTLFRVLSLAEDARPTRTGAGQAGIGYTTPARARALVALPRRLGQHDLSFAAADQTRYDMAHGDGPFSRPCAPGTR